MKYTISKNNYELESYYQIRKKYIEQCRPKNKKELVYYTNFSHILINIYFLGNGYSKTTEDNFKKTLLFQEMDNKIIKKEKGKKSEKKDEKKNEKKDEKKNKDTKKSKSLHSLIGNFIF